MIYKVGHKVELPIETLSYSDSRFTSAMNDMYKMFGEGIANRTGGVTHFKNEESGMNEYTVSAVVLPISDLEEIKKILDNHLMETKTRKILREKFGL